MTITSRHLVPIELRSGLDAFPELNFSSSLTAYRQVPSADTRPPLPGDLAMICCEEKHIPGAPGAPDVRVLIYRDPRKDPSTASPAILHIHGGGYVLGSPEINDTSNRSLVSRLGVVIVSVDYRLAPETPWPGALEDCHSALLWMVDNSIELGIDSQFIAVAGESAGGGHAAALALYVRDQGGPAIRFLLLDSPMLDDRTGASATDHPYCGEFVWTAEHNRFGWGALLGMEPGHPDVPASAVPAKAKDLAGLPATFLSVGSLDLFFEEGIEWVRRLCRSGVPVELHVTAGGYHGFGLVADAPQSKLLDQLRLAALSRALRGDIENPG